METKENIASVIRSEIRNASIDEDYFLLYLEVINAPKSLEGIVEVSERFLVIHGYLRKISKIVLIDDFLSDNELTVCIKIARVISVNREIILAKAPSASISVSKKKPYHGYFKKNPVYVCLGKSYLESNTTERHLILEAYLVFCAAILHARKKRRGNKSSPKQNQSALQSACLHARKLNIRPRQDTLRNLPETIPLTHQYYIDCITKAGDLLKPLFPLFDIALNNTPARTYTRKNSKRPIRRIKHSINACTDPELKGRVDKVEIYQFVTQKKGTRLDPPESTGGIEYHQITPPDIEPNREQPTGEHTLRTRQYLFGIAMHNQRITYRWDMLNFHEISIFLETIEQLACGNFKYKNYSSDIQLELAAVGVTLFLCSLPIESLGSITLNNAAYSQIAPPGYRYYNGRKMGCWVTIPPQLPKDLDFDDQFYASAERTREFFYICSGTGLEAIVDEYVAKIRNNNSASLKLFLKRPIIYSTKFEHIFSYLYKRHKIRLTLSRVSAYLHQHLARVHGGDLTTAMLLTGTDDFLGKSPLHYTAYPVKKLQRMYYDYCSSLMHDHRQEMKLRTGQYPAEISVSPVTSWNGTAGSSYRPRRRVVRRIVSRLQERMRFSCEMPRSLDKLLRLHNNMMRYTAILFAFSTGFRAVSSPLLPPAQIDRSTSFAVISDKDGSDYYNTRIVWLPPVCITQYDLYLEHLECLLPKLEYLDIEAFYNLRDLLHYPIPADRLPLFFFLRRDGETTRVRPSDIWEKIRDNLKYELPENASRHYLRSILLEQGCDPEVIAAFMGHWERGEEPWGRYSALSPVDYAKTLGRYLVPLLEEDGWKPLPGMQRYW